MMICLLTRVYTVGLLDFARRRPEHNTNSTSGGGGRGKGKLYTHINKAQNVRLTSTVVTDRANRYNFDTKQYNQYKILLPTHNDDDVGPERGGAIV